MNTRKEENFFFQYSLQTVLILVSCILSDAEIDAMMQEADADGNGVVNYSEFVKIMASR